jgi:hypothetical protein
MNIDSDKIVWLTPWQAVPSAKTAQAWEAELKREVGPNHVLYGCTVKAIGHHGGCDDVLFLVEEPHPRLAVVHLTYLRSPPETVPTVPHTVFYENVLDFITQCMAPEHNDFVYPDMPIIRWKPPSDLDISASPAELRTVMAQISAFLLGKVERIEVVADSAADPQPYAQCLDLLIVDRDIGPTKVSVEGKVVRVTGSERCLEVFASYFNFNDGSPAKHHVHFEYFEGNEWIAKDSIPLVVSAR